MGDNEPGIGGVEENCFLIGISVEHVEVRIFGFSDSSAHALDRAAEQMEKSGLSVDVRLMDIQ